MGAMPDPPGLRGSPGASCDEQTLGVFQGRVPVSLFGGQAKLLDLAAEF